jgi:hypothetical protein
LYLTKSNMNDGMLEEHDVWQSSAHWDDLEQRDYPIKWSKRVIEDSVNDYRSQIYFMLPY